MYLGLKRAIEDHKGKKGYFKKVFYFEKLGGGEFNFEKFILKTILES
jgi:hypothetical protein